MNITKLVRRNISQPMEKRIALSDIQSQWQTAARRGELAGFHARIRAEVDAKLAVDPTVQFLDDPQPTA